MSEEIKTSYRDIEIVYDERYNEWHFTLRGRERNAKSLTDAKEAIDKPVPKKAKPFERFEAWYADDYSGTDFEPVTVTSIVERQSKWSSDERLRVSYGKNKNGKTTSEAKAGRVYPKSAFNDEKVRQIEEITKQIESLEKKRRSIKEMPKPYEIKSEQEAIKD